MRYIDTCDGNNDEEQKIVRLYVKDRKLQLNLKLMCTLICWDCMDGRVHSVCCTAIHLTEGSAPFIAAGTNSFALPQQRSFKTVFNKSAVGMCNH
eukprot:6474310-Amphidinium_carterae.1